MNEIFLCLACGAAGIDGEPVCCDAFDRLEIDRSSVRAERFAWWKRRMLRRSPREREAIESLLGNRVRAYQVIKANAIKHGRSWLARRIDRRWPLWWEWTAVMAASILGDTIAAEMETRGNMHRWPPTLT